MEGCEGLAEHSGSSAWAQKHGTWKAERMGWWSWKRTCLNNFWGGTINTGLWAGGQIKYLRHLKMSKFYSTWLTRSKYLFPTAARVNRAERPWFGIFVYYLFPFAPRMWNAREAFFFFHPEMLMVCTEGFWRSHWSGSRDSNVICIAVRLSSYGKVIRGQSSAPSPQWPAWQILRFAWSISICGKPNTSRCPPSPTLCERLMASACHPPLLNKKEVTGWGISICS